MANTAKPTTGAVTSGSGACGQSWQFIPVLLLTRSLLFRSEWNHWGYPDPTHGRVEYVNVETARSMNLSYTDGDTFFMRTDASSVLDGGSAGRKAVRIETNEAFSYYTMVADVRHMPEGMGAWPALWSCGDNWPAGGELDIIEVRCCPAFLIPCPQRTYTASDSHRPSTTGIATSCRSTPAQTAHSPRRAT